MQVSAPLIAAMTPVVNEGLKLARVHRAQYYTTDQAVVVLVALEYLADESRLRYWASRNIANPTHEDRYSHEDLCRLAVAFELRRLWIANSPRHDCKKSQTRLAREATPALHREEILAGFAAYDSLLLLSLMASSDSQDERNQIYEAMSERIPADGDAVYDFPDGVEAS